MTTVISRTAALLALTATTLLTSAQALAQAWPTKSISLVVTYPAGGGADAMARLIAPKLGEALGQTVVVENKPGASGQIGASAVAKAAADGYTLMLDASSFAVNPALFAKLPYDSDKAFRPIGVIALFPNVLLANPGFGTKSVKDVVNAARVKKHAVSYASSGNGSAQHLAGAMFESAAGVDMLHVPYKGGAPALNDVIGGQVPLFFGNLASTLQHVKAGKLLPLAVTSNKRSPILPDVPTMAEAGVSGYEVYEWNALFAPAGTPETVIARIAAALQQTLDSAEVKARIAQLGGEPQTAKPDVAQQFIRQQTTLWARLVKERNISID